MCRQVVQDAFKLTAGALENPFLHLRAGQAYYELGETEPASSGLRRRGWREATSCLQARIPSTGGSFGRCSGHRTMRCRRGKSERGCRTRG